jgi:hypothetical protein
MSQRILIHLRGAYLNVLRPEFVYRNGVCRGKGQKYVTHRVAGSDTKSEPDPVRPSQTAMQEQAG